MHVLYHFGRALCRNMVQTIFGHPGGEERRGGDLEGRPGTHRSAATTTHCQCYGPKGYLLSTLYMSSPRPNEA
jgi:hypothetical protein